MAVGILLIYWDDETFQYAKNVGRIFSLRKENSNDKFLKTNPIMKTMSIWGDGKNTLD